MISLIVAYAKNRVIGYQGKIPWAIKGEQKRFRELTTGNIVIMGRKSYEEIGKPLPNRYTIVVSGTKRFEEDNCTTACSLAEALRLAGDRDCFISGGARLYKEAIPLVDKMYVTLIDVVIPGDTFFPEFDETEWVCEEKQRVEGKIPYQYVTYVRKAKEG